jgi:hypothetical protein
MNLTNSAPHELCRLLSGYLCGTHSGMLARTSVGRRRGEAPETIAAAHRRLGNEPGSSPGLELGVDRWVPEEQGQLAMCLSQSLTHEHIVELVFYGSQARGGRTGFSDVDAILVIADEAADDPLALRALRSRVLAAQRAVLHYQPMQHHAFDVATPRVLASVPLALGLPAVALSETQSVRGIRISARVASDAAPRRSLGEIVRSLQMLSAWPTHPWQAHRVVSMFELLPTLYLQRLGFWIPKSASFSQARSHFDGAWGPYDALEEVRRRWPRRRYRKLEQVMAVLRNPWAAVAVWRRLPEPVPNEVRPLLSRELLVKLQSLSHLMEAQGG